MELSPETIEDYFRQYAWSYTRSADTTWITGVRTSVSSFRIFIRLSEHWVYFVINPFVVAPPNPEDRLRVYYHILRLNLDMNMAKFGLDSDGDIFLAVELPTENFNYTHFSDALNGISHHAERLYSEIFNLSHNSDMVVEGRYDSELAQILSDEDRDDGNDKQLAAYSSDDRSFLPLDDIDLPEELLNDSGEHGPIIAGKEVRIFDDEDGSIRIEFETAHDLDDDDDEDQVTGSRSGEDKDTDSEDDPGGDEE